MVPGTLAARVRTLIERASPQRRAVIEAGVLRLAIHRRQRVGRFHYVELCASYLQTMVECCYETARRAWHDLRAAVGWWSVPSGTAEGMGAKLRELHPGQRHGQHLMIDQDATAVFRQLADDLGILAHTDDDLLQWEPVTVMHKGRRMMCRCPFHDDRRPSMILNPSGRAKCFACGTVHRFDPSGPAVSSPLPRTRSGKARPRPSNAMSSTRQNLVRPAGTWVLGTLGPRGLRTQPWTGDLLDALRAADAKAARAKPPTLAGCVDDHRRLAPDLLVHLDDVRVAGWVQRRGRWRPSRLDPVAVRFLAVDVDAIPFPPMIPEPEARTWLAAAAAEIETWAAASPWFSGRVALTRTGVHGVQVVLELQEHQAPSWRRSSEAAAAHDAMDARTLAALERHGFGGGHADPTARGLGRLIRRPGPRITKHGAAYVSRLAYITPAVPRAELEGASNAANPRVSDRQGAGA